MKKLITDLEKYEELKALRRDLYRDYPEGEFKDRLMRMCDMCNVEMINRKSLQNADATREELIAQVGIGLRDLSSGELMERIGLITDDCLNNFRQCEKVRHLIEEDNTDLPQLYVQILKLYEGMNPQKEKPVSSGN